MYRMLKIFASVIVFLMFLPAVGIAGVAPIPYDHLECYMVKDPLKVKEDVALLSRQFGISADCKIIGKERFFCGGVNKSVDPPSDFPIFPDAPDSICYRIECPQKQGQNPVPGNVEVEDQFGIRTLRKFNPHYLCTPAFKTGEACVDRAVCGGECTDDNGNQGKCQQLAPGAQDCLCVPPPDVACTERATCGGECIVTGTADVIGVCRPGDNGDACSCVEPPTDCSNDPNIGLPCGLDIGVCVQGAIACDEATGQLICEGETGPSAEVCNGLDDDCNGMVDDEVTDCDLGEVCTEGQCQVP